jgi:hypothetical protein
VDTEVCRLPVDAARFDSVRAPETQFGHYRSLANGGSGEAHRRGHQVSGYSHSMKPRFAPEYWADLFRRGSYEDLVQITSFLCGAGAYDPSKDDYGLGLGPFLLVESLNWFAQSIRSGSITYFEATLDSRQKLMARALSSHAPAGFAEQYEAGVRAWQAGKSLSAVDAWVDQNDAANNAWLRLLAADLQPQILKIVS